MRLWTVRYLESGFFAEWATKLSLSFFNLVGQLVCWVELSADDCVVFWCCGQWARKFAINCCIAHMVTWYSNQNRKTARGACVLNVVCVVNICQPNVVYGVDHGEAVPNFLGADGRGNTGCHREGNSNYYAFKYYDSKSCVKYVSCCYPIGPLSLPPRQGVSSHFLRPGRTAARCARGPAACGTSDAGPARRSPAMAPAGQRPEARATFDSFICRMASLNAARTVSGPARGAGQRASLIHTRCLPRVYVSELSAYILPKVDQLGGPKLADHRSQVGQLSTSASCRHVCRPVVDLCVSHRSASCRHVCQLATCVRGRPNSGQVSSPVSVNQKWSTMCRSLVDHLSTSFGALFLVDIWSTSCFIDYCGLLICQ